MCTIVAALCGTFITLRTRKAPKTMQTSTQSTLTTPIETSSSSTCTDPAPVQRTMNSDTQTRIVLTQDQGCETVVKHFCSTACETDPSVVSLLARESSGQDASLDADKDEGFLTPRFFAKGDVLSPDAAPEFRSACMSFCGSNCHAASDRTEKDGVSR